MKLVKPGWLEHRDENKQFELYTVDSSSDGERVATGGLDTKVRIWSSSAIVNGATSGLLATLSTHTGAVTCVRFSPDGRYLASGSDDRIVLVSERDATRTGTEFGSAESTKEAWAARKRLVGHDNDVQDLAWSPDGQLLVSVGLDSAIIVWSGTTFEKLRRLDWHQSHIKGIAFDPANKYFSTCSDDRTARIIRYSRVSPTELRFSLEAVITEPFKDSPLSTYFRRCGWSPDGETVVFPNATNGPVPTVAVVDRGQWTAPADQRCSLVGHEGPCQVAKFSPRLYGPDAVALVATGGLDGAVAIWSTANPRPIIVAKNVCDKPISDLAWSPDGKVIYASSLDGSVVALIFTGSELGGTLSEAAIDQRLAKYGQAADIMDIPESVEQVIVASTATGQTEPTSILTSGQVGWSKGDDSPNSRNPTPASASTSGVVSGSIADQPSEPPLRPPVQPAQPVQPVQALQSQTVDTREDSQKTPSASSTMASTPVANILDTRPTKQRITTTKDGRKRVTPVTLGGSGQPTLQNVPSRTLPTGTANAGTTRSYDPPSSSTPAGGIQSLVVGTKRKISSDEDADDSIEWVRPALADPASAVASVRLSAPRIASQISTTGKVILEARNGRSPGDPCRVQLLTANGSVVFTDFVPEPVTLVTGAPDWFWAAAGDGGVLYVWSPEGTRLLPPVVLGASIVLLEHHYQYLCAVTSVGQLHLWDIPEQKAVMPPVSLAPILDAGLRYADNGVSKAPPVNAVRITDHGRVIIAIGGGCVFTYDPMMQGWKRVSEPFWAYASQFWDSTTNGAAEVVSQSGVIADAEMRTNEEALLKAGARGRQLQRQAINRMRHSEFAGFEDGVSLAHLATRVAASQELESKDEYLKFLELYVRRLAERGLRGRLAELLRTLDKPVLQSMLKVAASFPAAQTLVAELSSTVT